jgi:RNA polymerase sigma-70 factor (ECF subfamily)
MSLFESLQPRLERFVLAMVRDPETAKDILGETILIAYDQFQTVRHPEAFLSFLFTVATRVHRKRSKRAGRFGTLDEHRLESLHDPGTPPDLLADIGAVYRALGELPEKQREAVVMFEILGFSMKEVQEVQGGTLISVKVRVMRARKKLAALLGAEDLRLHAPGLKQPEGESDMRFESSRTNIDDLHLYSVSTEL